ncbi:hypothetical protein glysoja_016683 [Glycine soja]|nr:hypothetical protein glysoja_016683 [Glycine soja]
MSKIVIIITLLIAVTASCFVCLLRDRKTEGFYLLLALVTIASAMVLAFRATMETFITVLVLLAFADQRRGSSLWLVPPFSACLPPIDE